MLQVKQNKISEECITYIEANRDRLTPDVSSYANNRMRAWIGAEAPLADKFNFESAPFGPEDKLWKFVVWYCKSYLEFTPEVALLHVGGADCSDPDENAIEGRGGECGIKMHRDAGYADFRAVGINLIGDAVFGYRAVYPGFSWVPQHQQNEDAPIQRVKMTSGTSVIFNCKNPHFAQVGPNRWCINAWRISNKRRDDYNEFMRKLRG